MWCDSEEAFAESGEKGKVQDGVGCKLIQLHPMDKQEPTKKFMGWKRKSPHDEVAENHMPSRVRGGDYL